ncbi:hypothetical protein BC939DRAFT_52791 [Gamsiella multidivaricata]|uniref:uncharacterized protein n=1 Tax=Gamsiella multidivaricata TaxID=101098 RepID=UPI00221F2E99|nr:uncharacterized protein BC939DRAFT_52791 [Gamsiella multidivaricata]KAG0367558.1 hypothetical protein BGZ54_003680 [Gamsiella multidivaricata]KAI7816331.1 hypothetical protein BC939DRAFT_52791 [Gamsiella multidivaricata]
MSSLDPNDPFDDGQPWQSVPSTYLSAAQKKKKNNDSASTTFGNEAPIRYEENLSESQPIHLALPTSPTIPLAQPSAPSLEAAIRTTTTTATATYKTTTRAGESSHQGMFEDAPPSYEATIIKDIPQLHDNYDHLRGPPGQRGLDIKTRIPLDSTPSSHYYQSGSGSGSGGPSRPDPSSSLPPTQTAQYGAISPSSSSSPLAQPSAPNLLQGQVSYGREDDALHSRDVDRLLGTEAESPHTYAQHDDEDDAPESHWSIVGDGKAWMGLAYNIAVIFPWALFCFVWTLVTAIIAAVSMIIPPIGYLCMVATVTSWRALARVDLVVSRSLVDYKALEKYTHRTAKVFVGLPKPIFESGTAIARRRQQRYRNLWDRGAAHLWATVSDQHTISVLFYFLLWKFMFALAVFVLVVTLGSLAVPFLICLLPTLLLVSRMMILWQFRWAVFWLAEKTQPIALP